MIKIGVYCNNSNQKKEIKTMLKNYFDNYDVEAEITNIKTKMKILKKTIESYSDYNIVVLCEEDKLIYYKRNYINYYKNISNMTVGCISMPLNFDKIENILFNEDYHICPNGVYKLITSNTIRAIPYGDINFCKWNGHKSVIYLNDGETEEVNKSIKKIKNELSERYFVECIKGYIINLYNIKKIDKINHEFIMYSGHKIPISSKKYTSVVRLFIEVMFGI